MLNILVTGGLGYIGSHICIELLNSFHNSNIIIIDNLLNSKIEKLDIIKKYIVNYNKIIFEKIDMLNESLLLESLFETYKIDIVIHLAGLKSVNESIKKPIYYYENNIISIINLIKIMDKYNCKNIIFSSSATVYGDLKAPFVENMIAGQGLTNSYGRTKYMQEEILKDLYASDKNWNIIILRYFNPISHKNNSLKEEPNGIPNNLFPYVLDVYYKKRHQLNIFGNTYDTPDGTCIRDFIHVVDLATGHVKACEYILNKKSFPIKTYNLGNGKGISVQELIDKFEIINKTKINYTYVSKREGDVNISYADSSLAFKELGWTPEFGIDEMVKLS